ncbi:Uncharacterized protein PBTT_07658 [Plasmodiophora brassicae]|uniref:Uncharacterized protein n=1 Tax=Plasmodiophora brassicae TaxID=37360 RepID=A0A0G4ILU5_PLABS|nr:hypothetical protein PBRA_004902 [Plasmodiophora brassicae]SPQ99166.1 unnamed protein product [Plasmodiophora brassicae]
MPLWAVAVVAPVALGLLLSVGGVAMTFQSFNKVLKSGNFDVTDASNPWLRTQADSDAFATCSALCCIRDSLDQIAAERRAAALRSIMEHIRTNANVVKADLKNAKDQVLESIRQYLARSVDTEVTLFRMKESPTKTAILATLLQPVRDAKEMFCTVSSQGPLRLGYQESDLGGNAGAPAKKGDHRTNSDAKQHAITSTTANPDATDIGTSAPSVATQIPSLGTTLTWSGGIPYLPTLVATTVVLPFMALLLRRRRPSPRRQPLSDMLPRLVLDKRVPRATLLTIPVIAAAALLQNRRRQAMPSSPGAPPSTSPMSTVTIWMWLPALIAVQIVVMVIAVRLHRRLRTSSP